MVVFGAADSEVIGDLASLTFLLFGLTFSLGCLLFEEFVFG